MVNLKKVWPQISRSSVKVTWFILAFVNSTTSAMLKTHQPNYSITSTSTDILINKHSWKQCILTTVMDIWRHDMTWRHVTASRWCHICQNVSPIASNRYDEVIFEIGIIKKVSGEKRQGGGGPSIKYVTLQGGRGSEKVWQFVTGGRGGKDHVMSHYLVFHNLQFFVLFNIFAYIIQIWAANITFRVVVRH